MKSVTKGHSCPSDVPSDLAQPCQIVEVQWQRGHSFNIKKGIKLSLHLSLNKKSVRFSRVENGKS